jgi:hypothetical protein
VVRRHERPASRRPRQARARPHHDRQPGAARFIGGTDAIGIAVQKAKDLQEQANAFRDLSTSLAREDGIAFH